MVQVEDAKYGGVSSFWSVMLTCTQKNHPPPSTINASPMEPESTGRFESILGNARCPTRGNVRATLPSVPTAQELGDEDEFQAAAFSSALAPSSAKKYSSVFLEFSVYLGRHNLVVDMTLNQTSLIHVHYMRDHGSLLTPIWQGRRVFLEM